MDKATARSELKEATDRLAVIDRERDRLIKWRDGLESWLELQGAPARGAVHQQPLPLDARRAGNKPDGSPSLRSAVILILKDANGAELTTKEILARARLRGADSAAKDPENVVDLILYTLKKRAHAPIERVGPRTWRWIGEQ